MDASCPYRRALGRDFVALPAILQRAHTAPLLASGSADVWRGGGFGGLLAALFRLPRAGLGQSLELELEQRGEEVLWWRAFDGRAMTSTQKAVEDGIQERFGFVRLVFSMCTEEGGLRYNSRGVWLLGLPLPPWACPRIVARVTAEGRGWNVAVRLDHPLAGLLCEYRGTLEPK